MKRTWEEMYVYAKKYYEHHGNLDIKQSFRTNDGYTYDENGVIKLGLWIANQRNFCHPESEKGKLLLKIGMRFEKRPKKRMDSKWQEFYGYLKKYYEYYGNSNVKTDFITKDGYTYDPDGIKLGRWLSDQKKLCAPDSDRGQLLAQLEVTFEKKDAWYEMYEYAQKYYSYYGNLDIKQYFRTEDGYTYDPNGSIRLGTWIAKQRFLLYPANDESSLLKDKRRNLLNGIGMIWKKNKSKNSECRNVTFKFDGFDFEKNQSVLSHISVIEFKVKIDFLEEKGYSIVDGNGLLHEIFSMSSMNMKLKYGVSLEDLVNMYKEKSK